MKKWSEEAWDVARPTYLKIIEHPFVEELARGTLAADKFLFYLRQDSLYLAHYSRVLTLTTHPLYSNRQEEQPSEGYEKGDYVAVTACK